MAQAVFVKITQEKRRFIYILHYKHGRGCRLRFSGNLLYWDCTDEVRNTRKGGRNDNRMNRTRSETREAGSIADGAQRGNTGQRIHCKGGE